MNSASRTRQLWPDRFAGGARNRHGFLLLASLLLVCAASSAQDDDSRRECIAADALRSAGFLAEATSAYVEILQNGDLTKSDKQCAIDALPEVRRSLAQISITEALVHEARGDEDAAISAYEEAMASDPDSEVAQERLLAHADSQSADRELVARAEQLVEMGLNDEARELVTEYITSSESEFSGELALTPRLDALFGGKVKAWRDFRRAAGGILQPVAEMAGLLIAIVVLAMLIRRSRRKVPKVQIIDFDGAGFEEGNLGRTFSVNMHSKLDELRTGGQAGDLALVTGPIEAIDLPSEVEAVIPTASTGWLSPLAWARAIPALINWITRQRIVHVTGSLHAAGKRGVGVTVNLVESNQILSGCTIWQNAFDARSEANTHDDSENLYRIAEYAAIWLLFETRTRFFDRKLDLLGARDWHSYALFRAGLFAEEDDRQTAARDLYVKALRRNAGFRGARTNLGLWYIRNDESSRALKHLRRAVDEANDAQNSDRDAAFYVAKYNLAVIEDEAGNTEKAVADTVELCSSIEKALKKIQAGEKGYADPALKHNLHEIEPAAKAVLAGIRVRDGDESALEILDTLSATAKLGIKEHYNLACSFSLVAAYLRNNPSTDASKSVSEYLDQSLEHLKHAFQLFPRATNQAQTDPTLEELRQQRDDEFSELVAQFIGGGDLDEIAIAEEPELPLAELREIGTAYAQLLADQKIKTAEELLERTGSRSDRVKLADDLGLSYRVITRWAQTADLTRIVGLGIPEINLLGLYRINSIAQLASCRAGRLTDDLETMSRAMDVEKAPDEGTVRRWIEEARSTTRPTVTDGNFGRRFRLF